MIDPIRANRTQPAPLRLSVPNPFPVGSSNWWIERLTRELDGRRALLERLDAYYEGENDTFKLAQAAVRMSRFAEVLRRLNVNLAELVVEAPLQRLEVQGFRLSIDEDDDEEAWRIWQANGMDAASALAHREALVKRECPVIVSPGEDPATPRITVQDPLDCIVEHAPGDRRVRRAALKRWYDDDGRVLMTLYLPDWIERYQERQPGQMSRFLYGLLAGGEPPRWEPRDRPGAPWRVRNPIGVVPVISIPNRPRISRPCRAEHETVLPLVDLYNKTVLDMVTTSEFSAFPQRYGIGVEVDAEESPQVEAAEIAQRAAAAFRSQVDEMITTPSPDAQFGQFPAAPLNNYSTPLDTIRGDIASITFTPYDFLLNVPKSVPASGEAVKASERTLVRKLRGHHRDKSEGWEEVMRVAFLLAGDEARAAIVDSEVIWRDAETHSEAQLADYLTKLAAMGVPQDVLWEKAGASPQEIRRWKRKNELAAATLPTAPPATPAPEVPVVPGEEE